MRWHRFPYIITGALNVDNCPIQTNIPIWMIIAGAPALVSGPFNLVLVLHKRVINNGDRDINDRKRWIKRRHCLLIMSWLVDVFFIAWIITGKLHLKCSIFDYEPICLPLLRDNHCLITWRKLEFFIWKQYLLFWTIQ